MTTTDITLDRVQAEAKKRGYRLHTFPDLFSVEKKWFADVNTPFEWCPDFVLDESNAEVYAQLPYSWLRGADSVLVLHRGMHHPACQLQVPIVGKQDDLWDGRQDLGTLYQVLLQWAEQVERREDGEGGER